MKLLSRLLAVLLSLSLLAGIGLAAYVVWSNMPAEAPSTAPSVELLSVVPGSTISVSVNVRGERVTRAELWSENQLLARETNPNPALSNLWTVAWQWTPPAPGVYPLAARAFDELGRYGGSSSFDVVVPPRGHLIFSSNRHERYALYSIATDTHETALFQPPDQEERQPNVSKTGMVAFASNRTGAWHILTRPLNVSPAVDLTPDLASAQRPVWSPDGQHLAFEVMTSGITNLVVSDGRGQNRVQVTQGDAYDGQASYSPDGKRLVFAGQRGGQWDLYQVDPDGKNLTRLTNDTAQDWQPAWSPDGGRIAFASNRTGVSQIYVLSLSSGEVVRLTNFPSGAEQPVWSPDGNWLAFVAYTGEAQGENRRELYLLYAPKDQTPDEGRGLMRLTQNTFDDTEPAWEQ